MRITNEYVLPFHNRWWRIPEDQKDLVTGPTVLFFPEGREAFSIEEVIGILNQMLKMRRTNVL